MKERMKKKKKKRANQIRIANISASNNTSKIAGCMKYNIVCAAQNV